MQNSKTYSQSHAAVHHILFNFSKSPALRDEFLKSTQQSTRFKTTHPLSRNELQSQGRQCIAFIKDPLWKLVCTEIITMMDPALVLKIWDSKLGTLSSETKTINIFCQAKEKAQLLQQYDFVILEILRRYFPKLNALRVELILRNH